MATWNPSKLLEAAAFAARQHRDQRRKDSNASPYINHPIEVARVLASEAGINDESLLIAALLHDTVEDTKTTSDELEALFGREVRALVDEVSDDKGLDKLERKRLQIVHAPTASDAAKRLKVADKICNLRDIGQHPPANWDLKRKLEYLEWAARVVDGCRDADERLARVFDQAITEARERLTRS